MKTIFAAITTALLFTGCFKDTCTNSYKIYIPVYQSLTQVRAEMKSSPSKALHRTGKIYVYGNYLFINEPGKGIHIIENSNPAAPVNLSFIPVTGNFDIAVEGNSLYADSYSDLVVFDISNISNIHTIKFLENVFPNRNKYYWTNAINPDSIMVVVDYIEKDTTVSCDTYSNWISNNCSGCETAGGIYFNTANPITNTGTGGSMASFTILNNFLYTVNDYMLKNFDIQNPADPQLDRTANIGIGAAETIFPLKNKLFIGTAIGMLIFDVSDVSVPPVLTGQFWHATTCDPVIADGNYAYLTLRSGTRCQGFSNEMDVLDIKSSLSNPSLIKMYAMANPYGLAKDGNLLFVCDGADGLKIFDATNPESIQLKKQIKGFETYDVILKNKIAIVVASNGLFEFNYANINNIQQVSKISVN